MESHYFGKALTLTLTGGSHEEFVGAVLEGVPYGIVLDCDKINRFMRRRAPSSSALVSSRREADAVTFLSGVTDGVTDGTALEVRIQNTDARPSDYDAHKDVPRPSHADFTARVKYGDGINMSGGGHFSGRMTAPVCAVGAVLLEYLRTRGVTVGAHLLRVGRAEDTPFDRVRVDEAVLCALTESSFPTLCPDAKDKMTDEIMRAAKDGDSVGGTVECAVTGVLPGLGGPAFEGIDGSLAHAVFGIPGVRGFDIGSGFDGSFMRGSENNDPFDISDGHIVTVKNDHGGVLGGITSGMPIVFRAAMKPTPSVVIEQNSVNLTDMRRVKTKIRGRHDACIALRAVPCIEAVTALVLADLYISEKR